ncbi:hypothetical protein CCHR01_16911 [Colletotrichum chrysophilum]|uniref:Uncharacterized protein n=1 Tax=Colletotrichum chrysophilum TaxID=1836956 RepID=A0AAD9A2X5_9PEZI|nr:hypothetical protein CCHR01_16911 [Colletotrichum chrysophilum]
MSLHWNLLSWKIQCDDHNFDPTVLNNSTTTLAREASFRRDGDSQEALRLGQHLKQHFGANGLLTHRIDIIVEEHGVGSELQQLKANMALCHALHGAVPDAALLTKLKNVVGGEHVNT